MRLPSWRVIVCLAVLVLIGIPVFGQQSLTVDRLVEAVKSAAKEKNPDKDVATWLGAPPTPVPGTKYGEWAANLADAYLTALRANPLLQKLILWELSAAPGTLAPLTQARSRAMMQWVTAARGDLVMPPDAGLINAVLVAAIQQFVLSAAVSGSFSGLPLRDDSDWDRLRAGLRQLVQRLYP